MGDTRKMSRVVGGARGFGRIHSGGGGGGGGGQICNQSPPAQGDSFKEERGEEREGGVTKVCYAYYTATVRGHMENCQIMREMSDIYIFLKNPFQIRLTLFPNKNQNFRGIKARQEVATTKGGMIDVTRLPPPSPLPTSAPSKHPRSNMERERERERDFFLSSRSGVTDGAYLFSSGLTSIHHDRGTLFLMLVGRERGREGGRLLLKKREEIFPTRSPSLREREREREGGREREA